MTTNHQVAGVENDAAASKGTRNNIVAESDLQGALTGIENRLGELKESAGRQKPGGSVRKAPADTAAHQESSPTGVVDNDETEFDEEYRSTLNDLLSGAQKSLPEHVRRIVQPVSDDEYFAHTTQRNEINDDDQEDEASQSSEEDTEVSQDEYDEEDLLDREALERARELRKQVREAANRVRALRDSVTGQAVGIAKGEIELLMDQQRNIVDKPFDPEKFESQFRMLEANEPSDKSAKLLEMEQSLAALMSSLEGMDSKLPGSIETLQETVETIEESMARQRGGVESLSQTERAIVSRDNEGSSQDFVIEEQALVPPDKRLASFLGQN